MAEQPLGADPNVKPGKPLGKPAPQQTNPDAQNTAEAVVPPGLESKESEPVPNPGPDHEAVLRAAKHAGASGAFGWKEEELEETGQKVATARRLVAKRNRSTDPGEVKAIDAELEGLGFAAPVATTEYQREANAPVGRRAPGSDKATA